MSTFEQQVGDTLALVNVVRQAFGERPLNELPDAQPGDASDCLYYRALDGVGVVSVGGDGEITFASDRAAGVVAALWGSDRSGRTVQAPDQFQKVISRFDSSAEGRNEGTPYDARSAERDFDDDDPDF